MTTTAQDTVIRMALACMAADRDSAMTPTQRQWVIDRLQTVEALTATERQKLHGPLLEWSRKRQHPETTDILARQFPQEGISS